MDQRLMVLLELQKGDQKVSFSVQQHCPFKVALEALHEFQGQILEWQRLSEEKQAADAAQSAQDEQQASS
jgi:hypothetical protein